MTMLDPVPDLGWLDVEPIINAVGCPSRLGGVRYPPEVAAAMQAAGQIFYPIDELQGAASREIVALTGAEAGLATTGAAGGFFLGACAILAGSDLAQIDALPDTGSRPNEFVVHRTHRSPYDHVVRGAGGVLREFGFDWEGTGTFAWQMEAAITDRTVGVVFQANLESTGLSIDTVCEIAHRHGLPVLVDAAEELPPAAALHRLLAAGADLIAVSGGKALMAPAGSGFLAGRKDLILSATMQCADMYVSEAMWVGPMGAREDAYPSPGHQGIGRMLKLGREEIVGLIAAIRRYRSNDGSAEFNRSVAVVAGIVDALEPYRHIIDTTVRTPEGGIPFLWLTFVTDKPSETAIEVCRGLRREHPRIFADDGQLAAGRIGIGPRNLTEAEGRTIGVRLAAILDRISSQ